MAPAQVLGTTSAVQRGYKITRKSHVAKGERDKRQRKQPDEEGVEGFTIFGFWPPNTTGEVLRRLGDQPGMW